jgi:hypothetical protein
VGRDEMDWQHNTLIRPSQIPASQLTIDAIKQGLQCTRIFKQLFCDWGEDKKAKFSIPSNTTINMTLTSKWTWTFKNRILKKKFKKLSLFQNPT